MKFFVPGVPKPGGSKRHIGGGRIIDACKGNKDWRASVAFCAMQNFATPLTGPLRVEVVFYMPRPAGHRRKDGTLKPSSPIYPTTRPDATKLWRSTEDALTHIAWLDDAQVITQTVTKLYGDQRVGASICIMPIEGTIEA